MGEATGRLSREKFQEPTAFLDGGVDVRRCHDARAEGKACGGGMSNDRRVDPGRDRKAGARRHDLVDLIGIEDGADADHHFRNGLFDPAGRFDCGWRTQGQFHGVDTSSEKGFSKRDGGFDFVDHKDGQQAGINEILAGAGVRVQGGHEECNSTTQSGGELDFSVLREFSTKKADLVPMRKLITQLVVIALTGGIANPALADAGKAKAAPKQKKVNPAMVPVEDVEGLPRVLLIGDSISIGYTVAVRDLLKGKANVHRPLTNCGPTTKGLAEIDEWLKTGGEGKKWDVIHFNWGLHDLKYMGPNGENLAEPGSEGAHQQVPMEDYLMNLSKLYDTLKGTGATLIWRTTTPVPEGAKGRVVGDSAKYNEIAAQLFRGAEDVETHDLYSFALERADEIQLPANVHYSPEGSKKLAEDVARVITGALK